MCSIFELNITTQSFFASAPTAPVLPGVVEDFDDGTTGGTGAGGTSLNQPGLKGS